MAILWLRLRNTVSPLLVEVLKHASKLAVAEEFPIYAPFTTTVVSNEPDASTPTTEIITSYEYAARVFINSTYGTDGFSTSTFSNISTVTSGLIAHDPIVVGWQQKDLSMFPTEYVSSLASRYNTLWANASNPTPGSTSNLPNQTNQPSLINQPSNELSMGARAGVGVGVSIGVVLFAIIGSLLLLRRKRKVRAMAERSEGGIPEMEDRDEVLSSKKWYLFGRWRNEMPAENQRLELDSRPVNMVSATPIELDTSEPRSREVDVPNDVYEGAPRDD
ncbi:hypothetical protein N0V90_007042 [Kalmusia sp. IMI 367209]|nr:hypothetical protein N0V90_007042 [Kalmusia sp. IMI 367209]